MNNMLRSHHRLQSPREFEAVLKKRSQRVDGFRLKVCPNEAGHARLGIIVSKRHVPLSVQRQRIKRVIREYFRCHKARLDNLDVLVMVASSKAGVLSNEEIRACLSQLWPQPVQ